MFPGYMAKGMLPKCMVIVLISLGLSSQREDVPAHPQGSVSGGEGRGIALVLEIGTETDAEVAHDLRIGDVQGKKEKSVFLYGENLLLFSTSFAIYEVFPSALCMKEIDGKSLLYCYLTYFPLKSTLIKWLKQIVSTVAVVVVITPPSAIFVIILQVSS